PDLARPLHPLWDTIELHADMLDGLCRQLAKVTFEVVKEKRTLVARIEVADTGAALRLFLRQEEARFYQDRGGELTAIDLPEPPLDRAVFLILAELARQRHQAEAGSQPAGSA